MTKIPLHIDGGDGTAAGRSIRVLIADPISAFMCDARKAMRALPRTEVIGSASNAEQTISMVKSRTPDLLLLDAGLLDMDTLETIWRVRALRTSCKIVLMSPVQPESAYVAGLLGSVDGAVRKFELVPALARMIDLLFRMADGVAGDAVTPIPIRARAGEIGSPAPV